MAAAPSKVTWRRRRMHLFFFLFFWVLLVLTQSTRVGWAARIESSEEGEDDEGNGFVHGVFGDKIDVDNRVAPKFKWGQDRERLFITITNIKCLSNKRSVTFGYSQMLFQCLDASNTMYHLDFILREDIHPGNSSCVALPSKNTEFCTLNKKMPHRFDRLLFNKRDYIQQMSVDWSRELEESDQEADLEPYDKFIPEFTAAYINMIAPLNDLIFIDAYFPWCSACNWAREQFAQAARVMKGRAVFGHVNVLEDRDLRRRFQTSCDGGCVFHVLKRGEKDTNVTLGQRQNLTEIFLSMAGKLLYHVTQETEWVALVESLNSSSALPSPRGIAFIKSPSEDSLPADLLPAFLECSRRIRGKLLFALVTGSNVTSFNFAVGSSPSLLRDPTETSIGVYKSGYFYTYTSSNRTLDALDKYFRAMSFDLIQEYNWENRELIEQTGLKIAHVFLDKENRDHVAQFLPVFHALAQEFQGKLVFVRHFSGDYHMLEDYGVSSEDRPTAFVISTSFQEETSLKYKFDEPEIGLQGLTEFCDRVLFGLEPQTFRSEPAESATPREPGKVKKIVARTFVEDIIINSDHVLLVLVKPWVEKWDKVSESLSEVASFLTEVPDILIATLDSHKNFVNSTLLPGTERYGSHPEIYYLSRTESGHFEVEKYTGKVTTVSLLKHLKAVNPHVEAKWESIQTAFQLHKDRVKALQEAERQRQLEFEEQLKTIEKVDIAGDGGILKQVVLVGHGSSSPTKGDLITAQYVGRFINGTVFDSSKSRAGKFQFELGKGQVVRCWDLGFATMVKGEKAVLTCSPSYAYGSSGKAPKIPPNTPLRFDVELVDFLRAEDFPHASDDKKKKKRKDEL